MAEMTVTVGLDMVSRVGVAVVSIADLEVASNEFEIWCGIGKRAKTLGPGTSRAPPASPQPTATATKNTCVLAKKNYSCSSRARQYLMRCH